MIDDFKKEINKVANFIENVTKEKSSIEMKSVYTYDEFYKYTISVRESSYEVAKSTISILRRNEYEGITLSNEQSNCFVIRQVFLNEAEEPVFMPNSQDAFYGKIVYANALDDKLKNFLGHNKMKTFRINREV